MSALDDMDDAFKLRWAQWVLDTATRLGLPVASLVKMAERRGVEPRCADARRLSGALPSQLGDLSARKRV